MPLAEVVPEATSSVVPVVVDAPVRQQREGHDGRGDLDAGGPGGRVRERPGGVAGVVPSQLAVSVTSSAPTETDPGRRGGDPGEDGFVSAAGPAFSRFSATPRPRPATAAPRLAERAVERLGVRWDPESAWLVASRAFAEREPRQADVDGRGVTPGCSGPRRRGRCGGRRQRCAGQKTDGHGEDQEGGEQPAHAKPSVVSDPASRDAGHLPRESRTMASAPDRPQPLLRIHGPAPTSGPPHADRFRLQDSKISLS